MRARLMCAICDGWRQFEDQIGAQAWQIHDERTKKKSS